ncbi:MAG: S1 RNA-binding domain-containing protein [Candidatus Aenigmarchaeota archaeon]|nr:S1 RNA-binding domain-containing protein [Candidatus Aenigmarchaeota archaeon]
MITIVKKRGLPMSGELVFCKITKINPNSAFVRLEEYDKEGMVHISEVSSGWVRDIRSFIKLGQTVVAKVMNVDDRGISLSIKRVDKKQENDKIKEYKLNQRAEKMLEMAAKKLGKTLDNAYDEVGYLLQEKFGTIYDGFKAAVDNPQALKRRGVPDAWITVLAEIAEKNIEVKEFEFSAKVIIKTNKPNGISIIKSVLSGMEKSGLEVHYIAAPNYLIKYRTKQAKKGEKDLTEKLEKAISAVKSDAEIKYEISA